MDTKNELNESAAAPVKARKYSNKLSLVLFELERKGETGPSFNGSIKDEKDNIIFDVLLWQKNEFSRVSIYGFLKFPEGLNKPDIKTKVNIFKVNKDAPENVPAIDGSVLLDDNFSYSVLLWKGKYKNKEGKELKYYSGKIFNGENIGENNSL